MNLSQRPNYGLALPDQPEPLPQGRHHRTRNRALRHLQRNHKPITFSIDLGELMRRDPTDGTLWLTQQVQRAGKRLDTHKGPYVVTMYHVDHDPTRRFIRVGYR